MSIQHLTPGEKGVTARSKFQTYLAGGAITKGDFVAFDVSKSNSDRALYVVQAAGVATVGSQLVVGVAAETVSAGDSVLVVVAGYVEGANVDGATASGSALIGPIGTAGRSAIEAPGTTTGRVIGVALEADVSNKADIILFGCPALF
jgi:hypothetical protein